MHSVFITHHASGYRETAQPSVETSPVHFASDCLCEESNSFAASVSLIAARLHAQLSGPLSFRLSGFPSVRNSIPQVSN